MLQRLCIPEAVFAKQGEHGTGRNVAPYVEMEWGTKAYDLMWEIKELFDPDYVLNPGVLLNRVRKLHIFMNVMLIRCCAFQPHLTALCS